MSSISNSLSRSSRQLIVCFLVAGLLMVSLNIGLVRAQGPGSGSTPGGGSNNGGGGKVGIDLLDEAADPATSSQLVNVILQLNDLADSSVDKDLRNGNATSIGGFQNLNARVVQLPANAISQLSANVGISYISSDREVRGSGHLSSTTGADASRSRVSSSGTGQVGGSGGTTGGSTVKPGNLDGSGVGIAVLDSGIDSNHRAFLGLNGSSRIVYQQDFSTDKRIDDLYGHGSNVASALAGNDPFGTGVYTGIAPNANIIGLKVLNSNGIGTVSGVLSALDWVTTNRTKFNIRVVNMSLGMPAIDSYRNDPICKAVRQLVNSGVVVVIAAGNMGKDAAGTKLYGSIESPGIEPSAITVGASNTFGTDSRADDSVATYSSRGPTRSYWVDQDGVKHHDNLIKPDLVAPGNKIINAEAKQNLLVTQNPVLNAVLTTDTSRKMMYMSGTSVAAPVVAGAAALLIQANPNLSPNLVKMILMYTAQPLAGFNMFEQGAGELNVEGATRLASAVRSDLSSNQSLGSALLKGGSIPVAQTTIAGQTFDWGQTVILGQTYAIGLDLITEYQGIYGVGILMSDGTFISNGILMSDHTLLTTGILMSDSIQTSNGGPIGDGTFFIGVGILMSDQVVWGDGILMSDGITGDGILMSDCVAIAQNAIISGD